MLACIVTSGSKEIFCHLDKFPIYKAHCGTWLGFCKGSKLCIYIYGLMISKACELLASSNFILSSHNLWKDLKRIKSLSIRKDYFLLEYRTNFSLTVPISSGIQTRALSVSSLVLQLLSYHRCQILLMMTKDKGTKKKFLAKEIIDWIRSRGLDDAFFNCAQPIE